MRRDTWLMTRTRTHVAYWQTRLALAGWDIRVLDRVKTAAQKKLLKGAAMMVNTRRKAMAADIVVNRRAIATTFREDRQLEETVVHELLHVLADGLTEVQTNTLAAALVRVRRGTR